MEKSTCWSMLFHHCLFIYLIKIKVRAFIDKSLYDMRTGHTYVYQAGQFYTNGFRLKHIQNCFEHFSFKNLLTIEKLPLVNVVVFSASFLADVCFSCSTCFTQNSKRSLMKQEQSPINALNPYMRSNVIQNKTRAIHNVFD